MDNRSCIIEHLFVNWIHFPTVLETATPFFGSGLLFGRRRVTVSVIDHQSEYVDELLTRLDDVIDDLAELSLGSLPVEQLNRVLVRECELVNQAQGL